MLEMGFYAIHTATKAQISMHNATGGPSLLLPTYGKSHVHIKFSFYN